MFYPPAFSDSTIPACWAAMTALELRNNINTKREKKMLNYKQRKNPD